MGLRKLVLVGMDLGLMVGLYYAMRHETSLAGLVLFAFGSGPIKGFAVVLCLGILTSMFTALTVTRALVNVIYGYRKVERLAV